MGEFGRGGGEFRESSQEDSQERVAEDFGIGVEELRALEQEIGVYKEGLAEPIAEVPEGEIDELLARSVEKSAELSPDVKRDLKRWVRRMLGIPESS